MSTKYFNDLNIDFKKDSKYDAEISVEPFERVYAVTIGNALRRTLLTALPGSAVTSIATTALAGSGTTVLASDVAGDVDFISFFVEFKGDSNTDQGSYKVYATKNGGFRYP